MAWLGRMREGEEREERGDGKEDLNRSGLGERGGGVKANKFICHSHRNAVLLTPDSAPPPPPPPQKQSFLLKISICPPPPVTQEIKCGLDHREHRATGHRKSLYLIPSKNVVQNPMGLAKMQ